MLEVGKVCGCKGLWKTGIINGKQRYRCKNCNKNQAETDGQEKYSEEERRCALVMYLKGGRIPKNCDNYKQTFRKIL